MAFTERSYQAVDGKWVLTLRRREKLSLKSVIAVSLAAPVGAVVFGRLSDPFTDRLKDDLGTQSYAVIVLGAALSLMLFGLHWLLVNWLPDAVVILNPGGEVVQRNRKKPFLWMVFGVIYFLVAAIVLYGAGFMEKAHA